MAESTNNFELELVQGNYNTVLQRLQGLCDVKSTEFLYSFIVGAYCFYHDYHDGQFSEFYEAGCVVGKDYESSDPWRDMRYDSDAQLIYNELESIHNLPVTNFETDGE